MSRGRARPQPLRVEQTVFGMPAPWRILPVHGPIGGSVGANPTAGGPVATGRKAISARGKPSDGPPGGRNGHVDGFADGTTPLQLLQLAAQGRRRQPDPSAPPKSSTYRTSRSARRSCSQRRSLERLSIFGYASGSTNRILASVMRRFGIGTQRTMRVVRDRGQLDKV